VVINEILADPDFADVNCDGDGSNATDEFIEIVNISGLAVNLAGAELRNNRVGNRLMHVFGGDDTLLQPGDVMVLFGGGQPRLHGNGNGSPFPWCGGASDSVKVATANGDGFNLSETLGEEMTLKAADGKVLDYVHFGLGEADNSNSIVREPEGGYNPFVDHESISEFRFSPGTRADGTSF